MCGKETRLFKTDVEGTILNVCDGCSKFGKIISILKQKEQKKDVKKEVVLEKPKEEEFVMAIVPDYGTIIKNKREHLGITQEDFAKKINEKISLVHKIETNQFEPSVGLARKIEKFLSVKLIEQEEVRPGTALKTKSDSLTIGDFIKLEK